jgi:hypothetical protein
VCVGISVGSCLPNSIADNAVLQTLLKLTIAARLIRSSGASNRAARKDPEENRERGQVFQKVLQQKGRAETY